RRACRGACARATSTASPHRIPGTTSSRRPPRPCRSGTARAECIARPDVARIETGAKPAHALLGGAMGEGIRHDAALGPLLEGVVTYRGGRAQPFLDVAGIELVHALHVVAPDPGEAVRLQLEPHRKRIAAAGVQALLLLRVLVHDPEQVLHVM